MLRLLTYEPTGALVAAPTMALPERIGGAANWDYRYTWIRDASWTVNGLMSVDHHDAAMDFWHWLESLNLSEQKPLATIYRVDGETDLAESNLDHLAGYMGSRPVRLGNAAYNQVQLDIYGEVIAAIHRCWEAMPEMQPLEPGLWSLVRLLADKCAELAGQPDHSLWEFRDTTGHFVSSKVMCWHGLKLALEMAERDGLDAPGARWARQRDAIRDEVLEHGVDRKRGCFTQMYDNHRLDAATLLIPLVDFLPADDPRVSHTIDRINDELREGDLVRRYKAAHDDEHTEGVFLTCSFWMVEALALRGELDEASEMFERLTKLTNDVGLLPEEIDRQSGQFLGNFPQGLSHLALLRAAGRLRELAKGRSRE